MSEDEAFVDEIRSSLRFIASVLLRRVQKVGCCLLNHDTLHVMCSAGSSVGTSTPIAKFAVVDLLSSPFYRALFYCAIVSGTTRVDATHSNHSALPFQTFNRRHPRLSSCHRPPRSGKHCLKMSSQRHPSTHFETN